MRKTTFLVLIAGALASCAANKYLASLVKPGEVSEMAYFEPVSYISLIEKKNKPAPNDSLSSVASFRLDSVIHADVKRLRISKKIEVQDTGLEERLKEEISTLIGQAFKTKKPEQVRLSPMVDSLLKAGNTRFAMASIVSGFDRRKGNYGGQVAKGAALGILTLGLYAPVPLKSNITIHTVIFDGERGNIAFYRQTPLKEKSPTDPEVLAGEFSQVFEGYLYPRG
ncbi:hypothetical protein [Sinomicrobium soli]|uniref:hypothetical protein n=1 Tax=Sinomicrobium sp. N-1-3-6 TaxID=2219864 RepID=UPI000DCC16A6|nr:hypothetical protein [Sinomicrobium sp. N-1-3-6]RAV27964.1 hypothetical protein DN748_15545 [Sinomicrobium sp. N-1-3-6]